MSTYSTGLVCLLVLTSTICMKIATGGSTSPTTDDVSETSQNVTAPGVTSTTSEISETTTEPSTVTSNSETSPSTPTQTSPSTVTVPDTPTTSPSSSTTANNSTVPAVSTSTVNTTSENTTVNSTTTQTPNGTTADGSSGAVSTTTPAPTPATSAAVTSTPAPTELNPDGMFILQFTVADNNTISCKYNCTYTSIQKEVFDSFSKLEGFFAVGELKTPRRRRRFSNVEILCDGKYLSLMLWKTENVNSAYISARNTAFSVEVYFQSKTMIGMKEGPIKNQTLEGFQQLTNNNGSLIIDMTKVEIIAADFAIQCQNICRAINPCTNGYTCLGNNCTSSNKCADKTCSGHGKCLLNMATLEPYCVCDSNDDYEYSGNECQNEEISKAKVIQIVSGVLGAFCALFLLIIIIMCCRRGSSKSSHLYQIGSPGYANDGYSNESELKRM